MSTRRVALAFLICVAALMGCANNAGDSDVAAPPYSASAVPDPTVKPSAGAAEQTITGTVQAGVEPNCRLIQDGTGSYLLVLEDASLRDKAAVGNKVTVTGRAEPSMMSTCQQGIPFIVASVSAA